MKKHVVILLLGLSIGSAASYLLRPDRPAATFSEVLRPDIREVTDISVAAAQAHREDRYAAIRSIEDTLSLPSEFAETEALYVIAGRADSGEVQNLIQQAARIIDYRDRKAALSILFLRMAELDPLSALAIARTPSFAGDRSYEDEVWAAWGRLDLAAALGSAAKLSVAAQRRTAQFLYASVGRLENDAATMIETTLDSRPGRKAIAQHVRMLADDSPASAIAFIESSNIPMNRANQFATLASYLTKLGKPQLSSYADLIQSPANRRLFEQSLAQQDALLDPESVLQQALSGPMDASATQRAFGALRQLAADDPRKALRYLDELPKIGNDSGYLRSAINVIAASEPQEALAWVRENDQSGGQQLLKSVLTRIAQSDPQLALTEVQAVKNKRVRDEILSNIVMTMARRDPVSAVSVLDQISDSNARQSGIMQLAQMWSQSDLDSALDWVTTLGITEKQSALQSIGRQLVRTDISAAIELLDSLPKSARKPLKSQIVRNLVQTQSISAAEAFVAGFQGTAEYGPLRISVIKNAAAADPAYAMQMARSVADTATRDKLYESIVGQQAALDPQLALHWSESISTPESRSRATTRIVSSWFRQDAVAASLWIQGLARGSKRDAAVLAAVASRNQSMADADALIDSISSTAQRKKARLAQVQQLVGTDIDEARRRLANIELSDSVRKQYEQWFDRYSFGY